MTKLVNNISKYKEENKNFLRGVTGAESVRLSREMT